MPRNGSGTYSLPQPPFTAGTVISSAAVNSDLSDIASALTGSLPRDGQAGMLGVLKLPDGSTAVPSLSFTNDLKTGFSRNIVNGVSQLAVSIAGTNIGNFTTAGWGGSVSGNGTVPIGTVVDFAGATVPSNWYLCYGQAVSRTTYSALFAAIGTTYGSGDGSTTFNLPDFRGTALFGIDNMGGSAAGRLTSTYFGSDPTVLGDRGGAQSHTNSLSEMVSHFHGAPMYDPSHDHTSPTPPYGGSSYLGNTSQGGSTTTVAGPVSILINSAYTGVRIHSSVNGYDNTNSTGSTTPYAILPPALVINKIIYAGG